MLDPFAPDAPEAPADFPDLGVTEDTELTGRDGSDAGPHTHLRAEHPESWAKPEDKSWGDWFLKPGKPLRSRHKLLARYCAVGKTNKEIAELLGYTESRVSVLLSNQRIIQETDLYRDKLYDQDVAQAFKNMLPQALFAIEDVLQHEADSYKDKLAKTDTAKWVIEKIDGKAAQKLNVESGTLTRFLDLLGQMQGSGESLDVTPRTTPIEVPASAGAAEPQEAQTPNYSAWIDENL